MIAPEDRRRRALELCRHLTEAVRSVAPAGLGRWAPAWEIVEAPSRRFLEALERWEASGRREDVPAVREAYEAVVRAWRGAAEQYQTAEAGERTSAERAEARP